MIGIVLLQIFTLPLPWVVRGRLLRIFAWKHLHPRARIGLSILLCKSVRMGDGSRIGHLTIVKGLEAIDLGPFSRIGNLNWITGQLNSSTHFLDSPNRHSTLVLGAHSAITHRHLIDCTDAVYVGDFATIAGWNSQVLTHSIDINESRQRCSPVYIGRYCFIGTRSIILKGSVLPDASVLAPGAVLNASFVDGHTLYGGVPARAIKKIDDKAGYFCRETGFVV